jgi:hypothetical protein
VQVKKKFLRGMPRIWLFFRINLWAKNEGKQEGILG